jgi:hypothetical protein
MSARKIFLIQRGGVATEDDGYFEITVGQSHDEDYMRRMVANLNDPGTTRGSRRFRPYKLIVALEMPDDAT